MWSLCGAFSWGVSKVRWGVGGVSLFFGVWGWPNTIYRKLGLYLPILWIVIFYHNNSLFCLLQILRRASCQYIPIYWLQSTAINRLILNNSVWYFAFKKLIQDRIQLETSLRYFLGFKVMYEKGYFSLFQCCVAGAGTGGSVSKLPPWAAAGAVIMNCGSGSLLFKQRI